MDTFAVCRSAEIPPDVRSFLTIDISIAVANKRDLDTKQLIDSFLGVAYAESEDLAPGVGPRLVMMASGKATADDGLDTVLAAPAVSGHAAELPPSPFIGMSVSEVAERLGSPINRLFVVIDSRSAEDETVLLATTMGLESDDRSEGGIAREGRDSRDDHEDDCAVRTVRVTFASSQSVLIALDMATMGFEEVQSIAAESPQGVYGPERRVDDDGDYEPHKGQDAPRMVLGEQ
ncbi:hypothetical protein N656DRAFT_800879 [Canariomyces notabilis]|uniref:DUF6924 domain-containing protein n=1 Tax=Canariomyces notabilis TaxID=2074819 RepID=A0AAN6T9V1_9PEZI|nr:hypothetical protein N656DRAFT_800879 [Canariomyces arenarius]